MASGGWSGAPRYAIVDFNDGTPCGGVVPCVRFQRTYGQAPPAGFETKPARNC